MTSRETGASSFRPPIHMPSKKNAETRLGLCPDELIKRPQAHRQASPIQGVNLSVAILGLSCHTWSEFFVAIVPQEALPWLSKAPLERLMTIPTNPMLGCKKVLLTSTILRRRSPPRALPASSMDRPSTCPGTFPGH